MPNLIFKEQITFDLGNLTLQLIQVPNGGIIIWIPEEGFLKTSMFHPQHIIGVSPREKQDVDRWLEILDEFIAKGDRIKQVILGFTGVWTLDQVVQRTHYIRQLYKEIKKASADNKDFKLVNSDLSMDNKFSYLKKWKIYKNAGDKWVRNEHNRHIRNFWKLLHPVNNKIKLKK